MKYYRFLINLFCLGGKSRLDRFTVMPCANAEGTHKLPLMAIGKSKKPRSFKKFPNETAPLYYRNSANAWQTSELFAEWFHKQFVPSVREFSKENEIEPKAVLLLDNCSAHNARSHQLSSDDGKIFVQFLPPRTTSLLQPMDQRVLYSMKTKYRKILLLELIQTDGEDIDAKLNRLVLRVSLL